jgi:hypothetical protein
VKKPHSLSQLSDSQLPFRLLVPHRRGASCIWSNADFLQPRESMAVCQAGESPRRLLLEVRRLTRARCQTADSQSLVWRDAPIQDVKDLNDEVDMIGRLDLSSITEVKPQTAIPSSTPQQAIPSQISFSLMSGAELSLLDLVSVDNEHFAEWWGVSSGACVLQDADLDGLVTGSTDSAFYSTIRLIPSLR